MPDHATITAVATASGPGAIGIVRVSGPACTHIVRRVAERLPPARHASLQHLYDVARQPIDRGIVLYFPRPASYTGEDMLEFHTHGGSAVLATLLESIYAAGAVPARAGEFTERAFLNGKMDLLQAEAVADLISASTVQALRAANVAMSGHFSETIRGISGALRHARAGLEASIDFSDEGNVTEDLAGPFTAVHGVVGELETLRSKARAGARLSEGARVVLVGPPNAGKSTLLNALSGQDRAIVSDSPGTTRDVLKTDVVMEGMIVTLTDTAGLHDTAEAIEREGIRRALQEIRHADLVLVLYAAMTARPALSVWLPADEIRPDALVYVRNKIDIAGESPRIEYHEMTEVSVSARYASGLDLLREAMRNKLTQTRESDNPMLARARHLRALSTALDMLAFKDLTEFSRDPVESAERLRLAQRALGEMTGEFTSEDLLGDIFSRFCIGK